MVHVQHLFKQYKNTEQPSVDDLSFSFEKGSIVGLLGPNGAGKTTTISILCGLIRAYAGDVNVLGHESEIKHRRTEIQDRCCTATNCSIP